MNIHRAFEDEGMSEEEDPNQETQPFGAMFRQHAFQTD
jgi:hypothetical protein